MNQNIKCIPLPDGNESENGFGSESDSEEISVDREFFFSDEEIESERQKEVIKIQQKASPIRQTCPENAKK